MRSGGPSCLSQLELHYFCACSFQQDFCHVLTHFSYPSLWRQEESFLHFPSSKGWTHSALRATHCSLLCWMLGGKTSTRNLLTASWLISTALTPMPSPALSLCSWKSSISRGKEPQTKNQTRQFCCMHFKMCSWISLSIPLQIYLSEGQIERAI